jgi:fructose-bisphosphate aldolase, class II
VLALARLEEIHRRLPDCHLVMHGSSSVPADLIARINRFGGSLEPTYGVPIEGIQRGIRAGVRKINIDTDCRLAMTAAVREALSSSPAEFDPRFYWTPARAAMRALCEERMRQFGQAGRAPSVPFVTLEEMARDYAAGRYGRNARPASPHEAHRAATASGREADGAAAHCVATVRTYLQNNVTAGKE